VRARPRGVLRKAGWTCTESWTPARQALIVVSAGLTHIQGTQPQGTHPRQSRTGHTRITSRALTQAVEAVAAQAFGLPPGTVKAQLRDDGGLLAITVAVPLPGPPLLDLVAADPAAEERAEPAMPTVFEQSDTARAAIIRHTGAVTGTTVRRVDIRLTDSHRAGGKALL